MVNLAKKSTNKGVLEQISSNQKKMNKNFNDLAKAVNSLATQSSELAKSFKNNSVIKYPQLIMEDNKSNIQNNKGIDANQLSFLKVDQLKRGSHALSLMLRNEDIIVGINGEIFRGTQKILNQRLKDEEIKIITIFRKQIFFNVKADGPLGIKLL